MRTILIKLYDLHTPSERKGGFVLLVLMLIGMALETLGIGLVIPAIAVLTQDDLSARYPILAPFLHYLGNPSQTVLIVGAMIVLASIYLIKNLFLGFLAWAQMRFAFGVQAELSRRLFEIYLHQPYPFHLRRNSAELIRNAIGEVSQFTHKCLIPGLSLVAELLVLVGIAGLLVFVEPLGAFIVVAVLGAAGWIFHRITLARITRWGEERQYHEGLRIQHLQQGIGGAKEVKIFGRENEFLELYSAHNKRSASVAQFQAALAQLPRLWLEILAVMGLAILVLTMLAQGRELLSIMPILGVFAAAAFRLLPLANRVLASVQALRFGLPVIDVLQSELRLGKSAVPRASQSSRVSFENEITLNQVSYTYSGAKAPALERVSISVKKGETIGLIGPSGAGKSTLVDVFLGLLDPNAGTVMVDDRDINSALRSWQMQIGYVPQSIFLTDDSLRRNIAFGIPENQISDDAVRRALRAAQLESFVSELPEREHTPVGERGVRLSGGQRQRVGIARALYHNPSILVLDEATSSLDMKTESDVMRDVDVLHGDKTILIIAHRLNTVEKCDRLYRMDRGRIVGEGRPDELLVFNRASSNS